MKLIMILLVMYLWEVTPTQVKTILTKKQSIGMYIA